MTQQFFIQSDRLWFLTLYPIAEKGTHIDWYDETRLPPYFVLVAYKQG